MQADKPDTRELTSTPEKAAAWDFFYRREVGLHECRKNNAHHASCAYL